MFFQPILILISLMNKLYVCIGIFLSLAASRFIPHPPNFTSLIALSFYVPALLGIVYLPIVILSFAITDIFLGFHNTMFFTWGSVIIISYLANFFSKSILNRFTGAIVGAIIFYLISNFGVWVSGMYENNLSGLLTSYVMAVPFFGYTLISTIIFSFIIEICYHLIKVLKLRSSR